MTSAPRADTSPWRGSNLRRTKLVCTIGPASDPPETIRAMIQSGMNVARLNFSHGTVEEHAARLERIRQQAADLNQPIGVMLDIQGPKIRIGEVKGGRTPLRAGSRLVLTVDKPREGDTRIFVGYPHLPEFVGPGSIVFIDDGLIELQVERVQGSDVVCRVVVGGELASHQGVSLPGVDVDLPPATDADIEHIRFGVENDVDFIAASFIREADHVRCIRRIVQDAGGDIPIIAKIESEAGLRSIDDIIEVADGVMVARGDLGVEMPPEEVPIMQKMIIERCNAAGKPVITATQMLESMRRNPRPTRAEVTDVANAIFDGTDAVMLSGETAVGKYPVESVRMMDRIAARAESELPYTEMLRRKRSFSPHSIAEAISYATCQGAQDLNVKAIICSTQSGATARMVARYRPQNPIVAATPLPEVVRRLSIVWGVIPVLVPRTDNIDDMIDVSVRAAEKLGVVSDGDIVALCAGVRTNIPGSTNLLQIITAGDPATSHR